MDKLEIKISKTIKIECVELNISESYLITVKDKGYEDGDISANQVDFEGLDKALEYIVKIYTHLLVSGHRPEWYDSFYVENYGWYRVYFEEYETMETSF